MHSTVVIYIRDILPIPLVGFANLAHMGAYQYMPSCFGKLSLSLKKKKRRISMKRYHEGKS